MILADDLDQAIADLPPWALVVCIIAFLAFFAFLLWLMFTK